MDKYEIISIQQITAITIGIVAGQILSSILIYFLKKMLKPKIHQKIECVHCGGDVFIEHVGEGISEKCEHCA
jgi:hypothetical protein